MTMRPDEYHNPTGSETRRGGRFELFFYEQVGTRYYLRFTRLALLLIVCLTVIPMVAICALFFTQSRVDVENVNINIRSQSQAPGNYGGPIIMPPPTNIPTPPKVSRSPRGGDPARQTPAAPDLNANGPPTPSPTPSPTPPRPPG
jgi:hypothetical protein